MQPSLGVVDGNPKASFFTARAVNWFRAKESVQTCSRLQTAASWWMQSMDNSTVQDGNLGRKKSA